MEPKVKVFLGEYEVVESRFAGGITIHLGNSVYTTIHLGDLQHSIKPGDKLPLYTEIPCPPSPSINQTNIQNS